MKKLLVILLTIVSFLNAEKTAPKIGCILAQDGQVQVNWKDKNNKNGSFKNVSYTAIKKEGINFKEIFVGSMIQIDSKNSPIKLTIKDIKANPRVKPNPRTGSMKVSVMSKDINKEIIMNYTYDKNIMKAKGNIELYDFKSIGFETKIKAILCNI